MSDQPCFQLHLEPETVVVNVLCDLSNFDFEQMDRNTQHVIEMLDDSRRRNVVLDFTLTDYFSSAALSCFNRLFQEVHRRNGAMAFCGVSPNENEVLHVTHFDTKWPVVETRDEALRAVRDIAGELGHARDGHFKRRQGQRRQHEHLRYGPDRDGAVIGHESPAGLELSAKEADSGLRVQ